MLISGLIVVFAFFLESIFGFGGGLISIPLLGTLGSVKNAVLFVLIFQLLMGIVTYKNLEHADWKLLKRLGIGIVLGVVLGSLNLSFASEELLKKILGITVAFVLVKSLFFPKLVIRPGSKATETLIGIIGGYLLGAVGIGSPVFTMHLVSTGVSKKVFRSTLMVIFFSTHVFRFIFALITQPEYTRIIIPALPIVPVFILAILLGNRLSGRISDKYFSYGINVLLFLTSISLLFGN